MRTLLRITLISFTNQAAKWQRKWCINNKLLFTTAMVCMHACIKLFVHFNMSMATSKLPHFLCEKTHRKSYSIDNLVKTSMPSSTHRVCVCVCKYSDHWQWHWKCSSGASHLSWSHGVAEHSSVCVCVCVCDGDSSVCVCVMEWMGIIKVKVNTCVSWGSQWWECVAANNLVSANNVILFNS